MNIIYLTDQSYTITRLPGSTANSYCLHLLSEDQEHEVQFTITPAQEKNLYSNLMKIMEQLKSRR